jgi:hypothetical protein
MLLLALILLLLMVAPETPAPAAAAGVRSSILSDVMSGPNGVVLARWELCHSPFATTVTFGWYVAGKTSCTV